MEKHKSIVHEDENPTEANGSLVDVVNNSEEEGEWSCIQCPEILPTKKSMMRHVQLDCKGRKKNSSNSPGKSESTISGQALANYLVDDDEVAKENLPPNKKAKKEDPAKKDGASWAPQITNVRSTKGQLISKCLFGVFQIMNENNVT